MITVEQPELAGAEEAGVGPVVAPGVMGVAKKPAAFPFATKKDPGLSGRYWPGYGLNRGFPGPRGVAKGWRTVAKVAKHGLERPP